MTNVWDAQDYDTRFAFVARSGDDLIDMLDPRPGQRVLDLGCGTGRHAAMIAERGADVVGVDVDPSMLAKARADHPQVRFVQADVAAGLRLDDLGSAGPFEGCLSNAALHWMTPQGAVLAHVRAVLAEGSRFVAEMGGAGNIALVDAALHAGLADLGLSGVTVVSNFFPTVGVEAGLLEAAGFRVEQMAWFRRPTPLAAGTTPADWTRHFRASAWQQVPDGLQEDLAARIDVHAERSGLRTESGWIADYCRLRFLAVAC